ncbi:MAG: type II secretion system protein [Candidatus Omnitrophota bacterium]
MRKGFTILELGVVMALMAAMFYALMPFVKMVRERARHIRCVNNLQKISIGIREFYLENGEVQPSSLTLLFTRGYISDENVFDCPFSKTKGTAKEPDYEYNADYDFRMPDNMPIVYDKGRNHGNGMINVLYLNGDIKSVKPQ